MRKKFKDLVLIRQQNQQNVLSLLKRDNLSCTQLAHALNLSNVALYNIMDAFLEHGIVRIAEVPSAGRGRKPCVYMLDSDFGLFAAVNLSPVDIAVHIFDIRGNILASDYERNAHVIDRDCLERVITRLRTTSVRRQFKGMPLRAICVSTPGRIDKTTGCFFAAARFQDCTSINLKEIFTQAFGCIVTVENDMHLSLRGALTHPALKNLENALYLHIGDGLGSALLLNGKLYEGESGAAGEFGSTIDFNHDPIAPHISLNGIYNHYRHMLIDSELWDSFEAEHKRSNARSQEEFAALYRQGDYFAERAVEQAADILSVALNNLIAMIDCSTVILTGQISLLGEKYLQLLREKTQQSHFYRQTEFLYSPLGEQAPLIGCINLAVDTCIQQTLLGKECEPCRDKAENSQKNF